MAEVERRLGAAVMSFEERRGGFRAGAGGSEGRDAGAGAGEGRRFPSGADVSEGRRFPSGVRGVAALADGGRVFVKAEPADAPFAADHRFQAVVAAALPAGVPAPRLLFSCERDGWVLLCSEVAPGRLPHEPWRPGELAAALELLAICARELTPAPLTGLPTVAGRMAGRCELWHDLATGAASLPIGAWERDHLPPLAAVERQWADLVTGDTLLHFDPRFDNIVIDAHGTARLVDWGRACVGPAWADLVCLLLESDLGAADPEEVFTAHPLGGQAPPERVDALLVALAGYWLGRPRCPRTRRACGNAGSAPAAPRSAGSGPAGRNQGCV